jgi:hypothetical protein
MRIVKLGNTAALDAGMRMEGKRVTTLKMGGEETLQERMRTITHPDGIWPHHSRQPAAWVESNDSELALALSEHFGCPIGRPQDWPAE